MLYYDYDYDYELWLCTMYYFYRFDIGKQKKLEGLLTIFFEKALLYRHNNRNITSKKIWPLFR